MAAHSLPGTFVPVTAFVWASGYCGPDEAHAAWTAAHKDLSATEDIYLPLEKQGAALRGDTRDIWEAETGYWLARAQWEEAGEHLRAVEARMGIFHPDARDRLESFVEGALALLDTADGDLDAEDNGDDELDPESAGDPAWIEWHTRRKADLAGPGIASNDHGLPLHEDDEEDDPDSGVEDGPFDAETDQCSASDDGCGPVWYNGALHWGSIHDADGDHSQPVPAYGIDQTKGGFREGDQNPSIMWPHIERIRRTRCHKVQQPGIWGALPKPAFRLRED